MRKTKFSPGRKWLCKRENPSYRKPDFYFVITGPGKTSKNYVMCDLIPVIPVGSFEKNPYEGVDKDREFSKAHLKKYGVLVVD